MGECYRNGERWGKVTGNPEDRRALEGASKTGASGVYVSEASVSYQVFVKMWGKKGVSLSALGPQ